jgi:archaellin
VSIYSPTTTHIIVDVATWYPTTDPFEPMNPARLADTRPGKSTADGQNAPTGPVLAGQVLRVPITNRMGIPADASAVVLNVTVTEPQGSGWLTVFPTGDAKPNASNLNFSSGQTIANLVTAKVGSDGTVSIFTPTTAHVIVDVAGWFPSSGGFTALTPARLTDTRPGKLTADGLTSRSSALPAGQTMKVQIRGRVGIPAEASAVALNVTVTEPQGSGWITVFPSGQGMPLASNLNFVAGQTIPNMVISKIGADGTVSVYSPTTAHIIVDVAGWFPAS